MSTAASPHRSEIPRLLVVMGVSGCGKSTIASALAPVVGGTYVDGDLLHPPSNIDKMTSGTPLTDDDRWPWLDRFAREIAGRAGRTVGACSALRRVYRDRITAQAGEPVLFIHLKGSRELIAARMAERAGHFMPESLLESQFNTLEEPGPGELAVTVDISGTTGQIIDQIRGSIGEK